MEKLPIVVTSELQLCVVMYFSSIRHIISISALRERLANK